MSSYEYFQTTFEKIYDIWDEGLWPGRVSKIEHMSALKWNPGMWEDCCNISVTKDRSIFDKYEPTFWVVREDDDIIGVNSGFRTSDDIYRSRGLYVKPEKRGEGLSKMLLKLTIQTAKIEECRIIWTMPRKDALFAYESVGFRKIGGWINKTVEFGPNCIAINELL
jgi:GNAT superfamily N-acetyltransferase